MATPKLQSFCCMFNVCTPALEVEFGKAITAYNCLCLISASLGFFGAVFQLWPRTPGNLPRGRKELKSFMRQNYLITWLSLADLCAVLGIIVRSAVWLAGNVPFREVQEHDRPDFAHWFCAITLAWIQYFYICTYFWTFCYAIDTYFLVSDKQSKDVVYHLLSWGLSAVLCVAGLVPLYSPSLLSCERDIAHLLPHYLSTYIPILFVILINPLVYAKASSAVRQSLMRGGRFTDRERNIMKQVKAKFFLLMLVFFICWFPNIINGVFMLMGESLPKSIHLAMYQFMAVVNPMQAFLNCLVYKGAGGSSCHLRKILAEEERKYHVQTYASTAYSSGSENETAPLLTSTRSSPGYIRDKHT